MQTKEEPNFLMRLTTRTNLAMRTLMFCAVNTGRTVRTAEIAKKCNASENHLGQVINMMGHHGFLRTVRGRGGGIRLAQEAKDISVGKVMRLFEASSPFAECFQVETCECPLLPHCRLRGQFSVALEAFYSSLDSVTLEDLVAGNTGLFELFVPDDMAPSTMAAQ